MRKRTLIDLELRDILSQALIGAIDNKDESSIIYFIQCACKYMKDSDSYEVDLFNLLNSDECGFPIHLNPKHLELQIQKLPFFELSSNCVLSMHERFIGHFDMIRAKAESYRGFLSKLLIAYPELYKGIRGKVQKGALLFNWGLYFECHEYLELVWKEETGSNKDFLKGLIHIAVAMYHFKHENRKGAINYINRSTNKIKDYIPEFLGVECSSLFYELESFRNLLESCEWGEMKSIIHKIPKIRVS